ncbi:MAG TPA: alkane 1-monooxygenase [Rhizomicrobium sp.]|nr:alkane 1-monooxygenase [Rhizomicrobium sp.]
MFFCGPFVFLASIPLLYRLAPAAPFLTVAAILGGIVLGERFSRVRAPSNGGPAAAFRLLPIVYIPLQLAEIVWAAYVAPHTTLLGFASLALSTGVTIGVFGVLAAHEMVHSRARAERFWGGVMVTAMTYRHFRIAHLYLHHRLAATARDPSTARRGESVYAFFVRTVWQQLYQSWLFEARRVAGKPYAFLRNRVLHDILVTLALYAALFALWGPLAALFLFVESFIGIFVLEVFNYVAHYGLERRQDAQGRMEPFSDLHSWNNSAAPANLLIFNMGRHSDHHRRPSASYEQLRPAAQAPELPAGYAGSIMMALVPPLWTRVMGRALLRWQPGTGGV